MGERLEEGGGAKEVCVPVTAGCCLDQPGLPGQQIHRR